MTKQPMALPWHQPWAALALFSFLLNYVWETLAVSFYDMHATAPVALGIAVACLQATLGDVGITLTSFAGAAMFATRRWLFRPALATLAVYLGLGVAITIVFEYVSVYVLHRWVYAAAMPTVFGIGTLPLVQWLVLPPIILWLARRHLAGVPPAFPESECT